MIQQLLRCSALCLGAMYLSWSPCAAAAEKPIAESETRIVSGFLLNNNVWGKAKSPQGWQTIAVVTPAEKLSWSVRYNWPVGLDPHSVKCYPSVVTGWQWGAWSADGRLPVAVSELTRAVSGGSAKLDHPGVQNLAYDLWFHASAPVRGEDKPSDELMIWMGSYGGAGPLGTLHGKVRIDGAEWSLYVGDIGWKVFSFIREENCLSWRVDVKAFIDHLVKTGLMAPTKQLSSIQFGTEVFSSPGEARLDVTDYYVQIEKSSAAVPDAAAATAAPPARDGADHASACTPDLAKLAVPWTASLENPATECRVESPTALLLSAPAKTDLFIAPDGGFRSDRSPRVVFRPEGPFIFSAKIRPEFRHRWDAGVLLLYNDAENFAKFCFEQDYQGTPRIVSVVCTAGAGDDCNSYPIPDGAVYFRIVGSADKNTFAFYASADGQNWYVIRGFRLLKTEHLRIGLSAQSPDGEGCTVHFSEIEVQRREPKDYWKGD